MGPSGETAVLVSVLSTEKGGVGSPSALKPQGLDASSQELPMASGILCLPSSAASTGLSLSLRREGGQGKLGGRNRKPGREVHLLATLPEKQEALKGAAVPKAPAFLLLGV